MNASGVIFYSTFCARSFLHQLNNRFYICVHLKAENFLTIVKFYFIEIYFS